MPEEQESETMRYGMIDNDQPTTGDKLEKYTGEVDWNYLKPHYEAGALWWVDPSLDLHTVGQALANDDAASVKAWLKTGDLIKPSEPHALQWEAGTESFRASVVSPFVLMQPGEKS